MHAAARGRAVTAVNGGLALALVVLLAVVALVVKPPAPPGISEFAPQASKPITKAPPGQAAEHGTGPGVCGAGQSCAAAPVPTAVPSASPLATALKGVPSALQCYQWDDGKVTQTFDPQSPPCIATWPEADKGNGGRTSRGVTATEVQITMGQGVLANGGGPLNTSFEPYVRKLLAFFNSHYQLYDRSLRLVVNYGTTADEPSEAHASAQAALNTEAFAAVLGTADDGAVSRELAQNQMISVSHDTTSGGDSRSMARYFPYVWTYQPPVDTTERNLAAFVCSSLKGKVARFASDYADTKRTFAIHNESQDGSFGPIDPRPLQEGLKSCGLNPKVVTTKDDDRDVQNGVQAANTMKKQGVTTVLMLDPCCNHQFEAFATQASYNPEWIYYGKLRQYPDVAQGDEHDQQTAGRVGLAPANKVIPELEEPYYRAGPDPHAYREIYTALQMLVAGIQMAGPRLTPGTFGDGLEATDFPNPGAAAPPFYQAAVGFSHTQPWAVHDFAVWRPDTSKNPDPRFGYDLCFVDSGRRWRLGTWTDIERRIKGGPGGC